MDIEWEVQGYRRVNTVKMYENRKMRPVETILRMGEERIKELWRG
jgi:hypothetical protein